jgi:hypothetical protein
MKPRSAKTVLGLLACGVIGSLSMARADEPAKATQTGISAEASAAIQQMGKTLSADEFSFQAQTIRVYQDDDGQPLHIFHAMKVIVHRPDRLAVKATGDDGANDLLYDGKQVTIFGATQNKYATIAAPNTIQATLDEVSDRLGVEFPLADLLDAAPDKSFLSGVTSGREVGTVTIDDKPYRHLFFSQTGGIELEVWLDKTEQALLRRLIVTYRLLPGQPNFIAEFSDWNFSAHPTDADFVFQPPAGAQEIALKKQASAAAPETGGIK